MQDAQRRTSERRNYFLYRKMGEGKNEELFLVALLRFGEMYGNVPLRSSEDALPDNLHVKKQCQIHQLRS